MAIKTALNFLTTVSVLAVIAGIGLAIVNTQRGRKARPGVIVAVIGLVAAVILMPFNAGLVLVEPNEVGVVFRQTGSGDAALLEPLDSGLSWVLPFIDQVIIYDTGQQSVTMASNAEGQQSVHGPVRAISSDGQEINMDVTVIYRINSTQVNEIHRNWRSTFEDGFIVAQTRSEVRNAVSEYGAEQIYSGGRAALQNQAADAIRSKLEGEGFLLTDFLIRDISFSPEFTDAIERKQIAEQDAQRAAFRVQQAGQEAEQVRVEAQGQADAVVIAAEGDAESTVIRAEADAEALDLINQIISQNPNLIQWQYVNELGENVRLVIIPSNSPFLFDLESLAEQAGAEQVTTPLPTPTTPEPAEPEEEGDGS